MTTHDPYQPPVGPEYIGAAPDRRALPRRRWGVVAATTVGVAAVAALGGWAALALLGGGTQPAEVIPARAVVYAAVDLDPSATQKIEAVRMLKKFPAVARELDITDRGDLRRWLFEQVEQDAACEVDYDEDVAPWLGNRAGVAMMPMTGGDEPPILVALEVTDEEAAAKGIDALVGCEQAQESNEFGYTFADGYLLLSQTEAQAEELAAEAVASPLSEDPSFRDWTGRVGEPGVVTAYLAAGAADVWVDAMIAERQGIDLGGDLTHEEQESLRNRAAAMVEGFEGLAGTLRFDDGALEAEWAGKGIPSGIPPSADPAATAVGDLPAETGLAVSVSLPDGWVEAYLDQLSGMFEGLPGAPDIDELLRLMEAESGLRLPGDIETLLGDNVTFAMDSTFDFEKFMGSSGRQVPVGLLVQGDTGRILPVAGKVRAMLDPRGESLVVEAGDGEVAFGISPEYTATLLADGGLGGLVAFRDVVPEADSAHGVFFVNFDAGDGWVERLVEQEPEVAANIAPLDALGVSSWLDGDEVERGLLRLTTD